MGQTQIEVYCRSCNRYVTISSELPGSYIEIKKNGEQQHHDKVDCDQI